MRHRVYGKHLGRDKDQRDTLFKGLVSDLLLHGTIHTSEAKAKAIKGLVDKIINFAKVKRTQGKLQTFLTNRQLRDRLIKEIVPKISNRNSGYTSLVRLGTRFGDQTMMVKMSLIGAEELKPLEKVSRVKSQESSKKIQKPHRVAKKRSVSPAKKSKVIKLVKSKRGGKKS